MVYLETLIFNLIVSILFFIDIIIKHYIIYNIFHFNVFFTELVFGLVFVILILIHVFN